MRSVLSDPMPEPENPWEEVEAMAATCGYEARFPAFPSEEDDDG